MLEVRGIDVFYGEAQALFGLDLDVADGEVICIVGPNGAGKTTLVQAVAGMLPVAHGSVRVGETEVAGQPAHRVCRFGVAIVPEGRRIFPGMTVADNLALGAYRREARGHHDESLAWVHSLFPRLGERGGQLAGSLSGGEQQMLAIGRALMAHPKLMLLDEPSMGLAPRLVAEIFDIVVRLNQDEGVAVLLAEQNAAMALRVAEYAYIMENGRIVLDGDGETISENEDVKEFYLGLSGVGQRKSYRDVKHYKRRKRWLS
jgi:branched-chain amino acid transport system ATP-binding protein